MVLTFSARLFRPSSEFDNVPECLDLFRGPLAGLRLIPARRQEIRAALAQFVVENQRLPRIVHLEKVSKGLQRGHFLGNVDALARG